MPVPTILPFARETSRKRSGSHDIDRERPALMHTPSPRSNTPQRPSSAQLSQQSQEERVLEGYVMQQVVDHELFQMRHQLQSSEAAHMQRHDEMMRLSTAYRQQQQQILELAEQVRGLQRTNAQSSLRERALTQEVGDARTTCNDVSLLRSRQPCAEQTPRYSRCHGPR